MESFIPENVGQRYETATPPTDQSVNTLLQVTTNPEFVRQSVIILAVSAPVYCRWVTNGGTATGVGSTKRDFVVSVSDGGREVSMRRGLDLIITSAGAVNLVEIG